MLDERRRRLRNRDRTEAGDVADEPPSVEEAIRLDRPGGPLEVIERRDVLGEGAEICVVARIAGRFGTVGDPRRARLIVEAKGELAEELASRVTEVLTSGRARRPLPASR